MERAAKRLVSKVKVIPARLKNDFFKCNLVIIKHVHVCTSNAQDIMKTTKYHKICFDQIEGVMAENKALTSKVDRLQLKVVGPSKDKVAQEEQMTDLSWQLAEKNREKQGKSLSRWTVL